MTKPLVSVLIPAYNAEHTVADAIECMQNQSMRALEIVVVNDGSTDATGEVLDRLAAKDSRIRPINIPHAGLVSALNIGLAECRAGYVARMDADDLCHPDRLHCQLEYMQSHPDISVCGCLVLSFPRELVKGGFLRYEEWLNSLTTHETITRDIFVESPLAHPSVMMRTAELRGLGGYRDMGWPEDYDLWLRYYVASKKFGKVERQLLSWRESPGRLTFTDSRYALENFLRLKAHFLAQVVARKSRPVIVWGAGMTGRRLTKHLVREGVQPVAVVDIDPRKIGHELRGAPIIPPESLTHYPNVFIIQAVGSQGARQLIRERLTEMGRIEVEDFVCAS